MPVRTVQPDNTTSYIVKYDSDGNGVKDDLYFSDEASAKMFEDCYVNNGTSPLCRDWMYKQSVETSASANSIHFYTKQGHKGRNCDGTLWVSGIYGLREHLEKLRENVSKLGTADKIGLVKLAYDYSIGEITDDVAKNHLLMMLNSLTTLSDGDRMTNDELDFIAEFAWEHGLNVITNLEFKMGPSDDPADLDALLEQFNQKCFDYEKDIAYCLRSSARTSAHSTIFSPDELVKIHKLFGRHYDCRVYTDHMELDTEKEIDGIICAAGSYVEFYSNEHLRIAETACDQPLMGIKFPRGTQFEFTEEGKLLSANLSTDLEVRGIPFAKNQTIYFYGGSQPTDVYPAKDATIDGVTYKARNKLNFFDNGKVSEGTLSKGQTISGIDVSAQEPVVFDEKGRIKTAILSEEQVFCGFKIPSRSRIALEEIEGEGKMMSVQLSVPTSLSGINIPAEAIAVLLFGEKNRLISIADAGHEINMGGLKCDGKRITFHPLTGKLKQATLASDATIQGVKLSKDTTIEFDENGMLMKK